MTTVIASPVDVVKTRYMNSPPGQYKSAINCAWTMLTKEGPTAFYKGWAFLFDLSTLVCLGILCTWGHSIEVIQQCCISSLLFFLCFFFRRFVPSFLRLGSWNVVMFVSFEQIKRAMMVTKKKIDPKNWDSHFSVWLKNFEPPVVWNITGET